MDKVISKKALDDMISELVQNCQVFAPVTHDGIKLYRAIKNPEQINWYDGNCHRPPKELFFPVNEPIITFRQTQKGVKIEAIENHKKKRVLIGARPCDVHALKIMDNVFRWDLEDELYFALRQNTLIIGLACLEPDPYCFCTATNLSPFDETGSDILLTDVGQGLYHARIISEKGKTFLEMFKEHFKEITPDHAKKRDTLEVDLIARMPKPLPISVIKSWLDKNFEHPIWQELSLGCIGCGTCAYLCPTCHCFDLVDETKGYIGQRCRNWDSCAFSHFTQMAAHQPRPMQWQRLRQRVLHKFKYFIDRFSDLACVGCGRCRALCPGGKDILQIIQIIQNQINMSNAKIKIK